MSSSPPYRSTVDFNTAMENFSAMFPCLSPSQIETVLRKNDGDVESSINDLLKLGNDAPLPSKNDQPPAYASICSASASSSFSPSSSRPNSYPTKPSNSQPNCEDDEKIALMLQNREFLRYLRSNQHFMRELNTDPIDYYATMPRRHESVLSRCKRRDYETWTQSPPPINPEDYEKVAIPDGPLVDPCERPLARLSKKIKSKLPSMESNGVSRPEDIYPDTVFVDYESGDERFIHKLKNMSKNSQTMFLNLAKKFSVSKKQSVLMPNTYADQSSDFSYDVHHNNDKLR